MTQIKATAVTVASPVGGSLYAPHHLGDALDYSQCWEARTALPAATTRSLPSMVGGLSLAGATADLTVTTTSGQTALVKTLNTARLKAALPLGSYTMLVVGSHWGTASAPFQLPGLTMGLTAGNLNGWGTSNVVLGPDDGSLKVRVVAVDAAALTVWGQIGSYVVTSRATTLNTLAEAIWGSNANAPGGSDERLRGLRIWPRALSPAEIATAVTAANAAYGVA